MLGNEDRLASAGQAVVKFQPPVCVSWVVVQQDQSKVAIRTVCNKPVTREDSSSLTHPTVPGCRTTRCLFGAELEVGVSHIGIRSNAMLIGQQDIGSYKESSTGCEQERAREKRIDTQGESLLFQMRFGGWDSRAWRRRCFRRCFRRSKGDLPYFPLMKRRATARACWYSIGLVLE